MANDYYKLGLDKNLRSLNCLSNTQPEQRSAIEQNALVEQTPYAYPTTIVKGNIEIRDGGTITIRDTSGTARFSFVPSTGAITLTGPVDSQGVGTTASWRVTGTTTLSGTTTFGTTVVYNSLAFSSFVKEIRFPLIERASSLSTNSTTYQNLNIAEFLFDPDDYPGVTITLEAICRAGAFGDSARTLFIDLYDVTGSASITGSEMSTATTEESGGNATPGALVRLRGSDFKANLTSGDRTYIPRYKSDTAGSFVDIYKMELVITY